MEHNYKQSAMALEQVQEILDNVLIGSTLYQWGCWFRLMPKGYGYLLQFCYEEPDVKHPDGMPALQRCRKWYVSPFSTETEVVRTAFKAVEASMAHRLGEHFTYKGKQIHSPHLDIDALISIADIQDKRK